MPTEPAPLDRRQRNRIRWILASLIGLVAAGVFLNRWIAGPAEWGGVDGMLTEDELARELDKGEPFATGANFSVQKFPDNCTLSVELGKEAVVGVSSDKERILTLFFSSLVEDLSGAEALTLQFGDEAPLTLRVARGVTIVNVPVLFLDIPSGLGRQWRAADTLTVANGDKPIGTFAMGEAKTKAPDVLAECVNSL
jgi:hypothetical protein